MIEKRTIVEQVEVLGSGIIQVRLAFLLAEGNEVYARDVHRISIPPGTDVAAQCAAVNRNLASLKKETITEADIAKIKAHAQLAHTPEAIAAYKAASENYQQ